MGVFADVSLFPDIPDYAMPRTRLMCETEALSYAVVRPAVQIIKARTGSAREASFQRVISIPLTSWLF